MDAAKTLKFGDVIRFEFGGSPVTAMVLATRVNAFMMTDEDTSMSPDHSNRVIVLGLTNDGDPEDYGEYHNVGKTATVILDEVDVEILP